MIRECSLEDISDGRLYTENDLVKADTNNCMGCQSVCCHGMGKTIILDPLDAYRLSSELQMPMEEMLSNGVELNLVDGMILPNLKMAGDKEQCIFLAEDKRCKIHAARPGICRLFPLGRYWEDETHFKYILQTGQCHKSNLSKIKVKKWLDTADLQQYNEFVIMWHKYLKKMEAAMVTIHSQKQAGELSDEQEDTQIKTICMYTLRTFYLTPYDKAQDFYEQFARRCSNAYQAMGIVS
jgi:Fe-S-cluster containining protein